MHKVSSGKCCTLFRVESYTNVHIKKHISQNDKKSGIDLVSLTAVFSVITQRLQGRLRIDLVQSMFCLSPLSGKGQSPC